MYQYLNMEPYSPNTSIRKNHFFELLIKISNSNLLEYNIANISSRLKKIITKKIYCSHDSLLHSLNFNVTNNFIIIYTNNISENLHHVNKYLNRVLHQFKIAVFDSKSFLPIFYLEKSINDAETICKNNENTYFKSYVYNKLNMFPDGVFDKNKIRIHKNYIGSYIVIFNHNGTWYFTYSNNIYELRPSNHPILFQHIHRHINRLDSNLCYHLILVDNRLRKIIPPYCNTNHIVFIKSTEKYTLIENYKNTYNFFVDNKQIYFSCMDELYFQLEVIDQKNIRSRKIINRGFLMKIKDGNYDDICLSFDTKTYKNIISMIPRGLHLHEIHLYFYQTDKLNDFLQHVDDAYNDMIKRINIAMTTMSREILDIYHMTRQKKNSQLYCLLPHSYRQILYQLHSDYIAHKNNKEINSSNFENKVSVSVDDVYIKLKCIDISLLSELFRDREIVIKNIAEFEGSHTHDVIDFGNPIKSCTSTTIQSKLLSLNYNCIKKDDNI